MGGAQLPGRSQSIWQAEVKASGRQKLEHLGGGDFEGAAGGGDPFAFEGVHAFVGDAEQGGGVAGVVGVDGEAEAGGDGERVAFDEQGFFEGDADGLEELIEAAVAVELGSDEDELVAAEAGEGIGAADELAEAGGDAAEDLIAGLMAESVVDVFKAVEVEDEQGEVAAGFVAAVECEGERLFEGAAVGQAGELVVEGEPLVADDLFFEHDEDHADGDEGLLHVPDVGGDVGELAVADDEGMDEEAERPDEEAGEDGEAAGAVAGQAVFEFEGGDGVDAGEAPVDGLAEFGVADQQADGDPAAEVKGGAEPGPAKEQGAAAGEQDAGDDGDEVRAGGVDVHAVEGVYGEQGNGVDGDVEEADLGADGMAAGVPGEDEAGEQIAVEHDDVQAAGREAAGGIEDVGDGLDEGDEQAEEPDAGLLLRMAMAHEQKDRNEDGEGREIGKER